MRAFSAPGSGAASTSTERNACPWWEGHAGSVARAGQERLPGRGPGQLSGGRSRRREVRRLTPSQDEHRTTLERLDVRPRREAKAPHAALVWALRYRSATLEAEQ